MTRQEVINILSKTGYTVREYPKSNVGVVIFYGEKDRGARVSFLRDVIAPAVKGSYQTRTAIKSSVGGVVVGPITIVTKPAKDVDGSLASLDARIFSRLGKKIKYVYADEEIDAVEFTDPAVLRKSILEGIRAAPMLDDSLVDSVQSIFDGRGVAWGDQTDAATRAKLGVYLGELLVGLVALNPEKARRDYLRNNVFGATKAKRFIIPTDPRFSGVDSFMEMVDGTLYPISSKFGTGAAASIFANLMPKAVAKKNLPKSFLKELVDASKEASLLPGNSRAIVYQWGIRGLLGIPKSQIADPNQVYEQIRMNKIGKEATIAIARAAALKKLPPPLTSFKPDNMSFLFNMTIAERLMADPVSMQQIKEILAGKKYWQMNLDQGLWTNTGEVKFNAVLSGDASIKIVGNKSASNNIQASQGWINYVLKLQ